MAEKMNDMYYDKNHPLYTHSGFIQSRSIFKEMVQKHNEFLRSLSKEYYKYVSPFIEEYVISSMKKGELIGQPLHPVVQAGLQEFENRNPGLLGHIRKRE